MTTVVVDASVGLKWCVPQGTEPLIAEAAELLKSYGRMQINFFVPDLFWIEVGNALWKWVRTGKIPLTLAASAYASVRDLEIATFPSLGLSAQAFQIATTHDRTVYDSLYVALAESASIDLVTADERLANALAPHFSVKWLGTF